MPEEAPWTTWPATHFIMCKFFMRKRLLLKQNKSKGLLKLYVVANGFDENKKRPSKRFFQLQSRKCYLTLLPAGAAVWKLVIFMLETKILICGEML